jgi:predicted glycosyltransferase
MDPGFSTIFPTEKNRSLEEVQEQRTKLLYSLFDETAPDLFMVELYPFGRKRFHFELLPILKAIHRGDFGSTRVVCSLRDILVEKEDQESYERGVLDILNKYFGALLVHADSALVSLDETFASTAAIKIPVVYTGYVTARPSGEDGANIRKRLKLKENEPLIVASAGGGRVGADLLRAVLAAHARLAESREVRLCVFTGPFMAERDFSALKGKATSVPGVQLSRFTTEFLSFLAGADLSISMAGYNTCMNILATEVPALVWPFGQNQEQRLRAQKLAGLGCLSLLNQEDLEPSRLAALMEKALEAGKDSVKPSINLAGAEETARWLEEWCGLEEGRKS